MKKTNDERWNQQQAKKETEKQNLLAAHTGMIPDSALRSLTSMLG